MLAQAVTVIAFNITVQVHSAVYVCVSKRISPDKGD